MWNYGIIIALITQVPQPLPAVVSGCVCFLMRSCVLYLLSCFSCLVLWQHPEIGLQKRNNCIPHLKCAVLGRPPTSLLSLSPFGLWRPESLLQLGNYASKLRTALSFAKNSWNKRSALALNAWRGSAFASQSDVLRAKAGQLNLK